MEPNPGARTETQTRILAAALEAFAERGFASTTTAEISRRAGVAEKTLFSHFKSKEALFEQTLNPATLELLMPDVKAGLFVLLQGEWDPLEDFLTALMRNRIEVFARHPAKFKLIVQELILRPERADPFRETYDCKFAPLFHEIFDRLRRKGQLGALRPELTQRMIASTIMGYALQRFVLRPQCNWDDEKEIRDMVSVLVHGLRSASSVSAEPEAQSAPRSTRKISKG
jgi:AcrR family transcriptional regulator